MLFCDKLIDNHYNTEAEEGRRICIRIIKY